ncbi:hypothetical protein UFOVP1537_2 [uncultured Caudovirales phage]|uniref:Uncharacterized protein n=2 Tax=root TaxID=1 RepID=A0A6J5QEZ8_9CAUD|nr:hypothetical protein UFOVP825_20 [uncultured Caudovirales phage]CAB4171166.1 hypothetical protein UFOVP915_2 [uncultured Caudovirales phage]CAB4177202.1 hypothetical protein UFOVP1000_19 [uncultured Caudovirales phage]CAB4183280.1 hypothetical protein UFOVP1092_47 [uncultured Caudovirales phage]CAB4187718.1 hypothetical protein UFOVP1152_51 [uncultured Caudovirales phage]
MAGTNFPPILGMKADSGIEVRLYTVESGSTFIAGALVYLDTSTHTIKECGTDPSLILGVAYASAAAGLTNSLWGGTAIPVAVLTSNAIVAMASATTAATTYIGTSYGIVKSTNWLVDTSDTTNDRVMVVDVSVSPEIWYVRFVTANLQMTGLAV